MIVPLPGSGCGGEFEPGLVADPLPPGTFAPGCPAVDDPFPKPLLVPDVVPDPEGFVPPKPLLKPLPGSPLPGRMMLMPPLTVPDPAPVAPPRIVSVIAVLLPRLPVAVGTVEPVELAELPAIVPLEPPLENPPPPLPPENEPPPPEKPPLE